jgi:hypothetical protein
MTIVDLTRPCPGGAPPGGDDPGEVIDGDGRCPVCAAVGGPVEFHRGWVAGWDACAAFVVGSLTADRDAGGAS